MNALEVGAGPFWVRGSRAERIPRTAGSPQLADPPAGPRHERSGPTGDIVV